MHLLVNTLSIGSMSGRHVVYGFLQPFGNAILPDHQMTVLHYDSAPPPDDVMRLGVKAIAVPDRFRHWLKRLLWEAWRLPGLIRRHGVDVALTVSGALMPRCPVPQAVLCQNPWCYHPAVHRNAHDRFKARLQRIGYGSAFRDADLMIYISNHLRQLYTAANPNSTERRHRVALVGLNQSTYEAAKRLAHLPRDPYSILAVSAMANWKGAHTLVSAVAMLHQRDIPAKLRLVGPWPDSDYEATVRRQIHALGLTHSVDILGRVSDQELHRQYATNQLFALPSQCESFGIPAAEAMAFGTPVVSTSSCAISEVCQQAGLFGPVGDPGWMSDAIERLMIDRGLWNQLSLAGRERASELTWHQCFKPLLEIESLVAPKSDR